LISLLNQSKLFEGFMKSYLKLFTLFLLVISISEIFATGVLYVRPRWSSASYEKMWIKNIDVNVSIQDQVAVTQVDQIFFNEMTESVEAIYIFPLPENAMITSLVYWFNGQRYEAEIRERQDAINDYNDHLSQWLDPALLEYMGDNLFRLSIVPVDALSEVRTEITYVEMLNYDFGVNYYKHLLNTLELSSQPVESVHVFLDANSQSPYKYFQSPSHENSTSTLITKVSDYHYTLEFGDENFFPDKDLLVEFETVRDEVQFNILTYSPTEEDSMGTDSFYALWITPPDTISEDQTIPKDIVFTADVSSSMEGERIEQLRESLYRFLELLNPIDRFNIITFGTHVKKFADDLVEANTTNITAAETFVSQIYALGMTNISGAIEASFNQSYGEESSNNLIFLTDGKPTMGITDPNEIISFVNEQNDMGVQLFSFGIGENLNRAFLTQLSMENNGYATFIESDDDIALLVTNHFTRISKPIITNLSLDYGGFQVFDTYPKILSDLFYGTQTMEMGLYNSSGSSVITLNGEILGEPVEFSKIVTFAGEGGYRFVPRLWAKAKINHLLDLIEIYGETDELVDQIIELSLRFQVLTKYTAFYVDPDPTGIDPPADNLPEKFEVAQNYPNPFNPVTTIKYSLPSGSSNYHVIIKVYDITGKVVRTLTDKTQQSGTYEVLWNSKDDFGNSVSSGIYFYTVQVFGGNEKSNFTKTLKMILLK